MEQSVFTCPYGSVRADPAVPCVILQLHRFANRIEFIDLMERGLAYYQAHSSAAQPWGWIGDTRQMGAIPQAVQEWLAKDWNPRAYAAGIRELSIVMAESVLGRIAAQQYAHNTLAGHQHHEIYPVTYPTLEAAKQSIHAHLQF